MRDPVDYRLHKDPPDLSISATLASQAGDITLQARVLSGAGEITSRWRQRCRRDQPLTTACSCFCQISTSNTFVPLALRGKLHFYTCRQHFSQLESNSFSPAGPVKVTDTLITNS